MVLNIIQTLSIGNTRRNFTITMIARSIGILLLLARKAPRMYPSFRELIEEKSEIYLRELLGRDVDEAGNPE